MDIFSQRLKVLRQDTKVTQKIAAQESGITERSYIRLENNQFTPSAETLIKLADYYNVSLDFLVGRSDVPERR